MQCPRCGNAVDATMTACPSCRQVFSAARPSGELYVRDPKDTKRAIWWFVAPWVALPVILMAYAIVRFVLGSLGAAAEVDTATGLGTVSLGETVGRIVSVVLGLAGVVALVCMILGLFLGLYYLGKRDIASGVDYDQRSGKGSGSEVPPEIKKWSWGAVGLPIIWGVYHHAWLSLLSMVPILNFVWWIVMGIKGNEWAWQSQKWVSMEDFHNRQKGWGIVGAIFFFLGIIQMLISFGSLAAIITGLSQIGTY